jgi:hypothetical protein
MLEQSGKFAQCAIIISPATILAAPSPHRIHRPLLCYSHAKFPKLRRQRPNGGRPLPKHLGDQHRHALTIDVLAAIGQVGNATA